MEGMGDVEDGEEKASVLSIGLDLNPPYVANVGTRPYLMDYVMPKL